ncbi:hypothetical protein GGR54DRAFT_639961 [Hypoxylon sp. NC1633]|nr:hypothetical protein GGR54DRAFT_639961 [Hypoxylon sp. NC1633]
MVLAMVRSMSAITLPTARIEAADSIALANMTMKAFYDQKRQPKFFRTGDRVYLRLHKGYTIPAVAAVEEDVDIVLGGTGANGIVTRTVGVATAHTAGAVG